MFFGVGVGFSERHTPAVFLSLQTISLFKENLQYVVIKKGFPAETVVRFGGLEEK